jgi:hypothetical protein
VATSALPLVFIHRSAWKANSPTFAKPRSSTVRACPPYNSARTYFGSLIGAPRPSDRTDAGRRMYFGPRSR